MYLRFQRYDTKQNFKLHLLIKRYLIMQTCIISLTIKIYSERFKLEIVYSLELNKTFASEILLR